MGKVSVGKLLARLRTVLQYKPRKGHFVWLVQRQCHGGYVKPGDVAGTKLSDTYGTRCQIGFEGKVYRVHRLAFLFMTGKWPPKGRDVDHINGRGDDNRWCNLRPATRGQNNWNNHNLRSDNKSGKTGVSWSIQGDAWTARVTVNKKIIHLGYFDDLEEAVEVRRAAELKYFGEFAPK